MDMINNLFEQQISQIDTLDTDAIIMREINSETSTQVMVNHHYSHTAPQAQVNLGFYINDDRFTLGSELSTVIMYASGANRYISSIIEGTTQDDVFELVRLFSYDWAPKNIESYCIGQSFKWLKKNRPDKKYVISYADLNFGHIGTIYQATNWLYTGLGAKGKTKIFLIDGNPKHARSIYADVGNNKIDDVRAYYGDRLEEKIIAVLPKARYLYFLCDKREKKRLMDKLTVPVYEGQYPKSYQDALQLENDMKGDPK